MTTMNATEITAPGGPEVLQSCTRPRPVPNADQVIIRVSYAGVNRPDALQRAGLYNPPAGASDLPGLEASGTVVEIGENVSDLAVGDRVCALLPGGGYAEYTLCQRVEFAMLVGQNRTLNQYDPPPQHPNRRYVCVSFLS